MLSVFDPFINAAYLLVSWLAPFTGTDAATPVIV